MGKTLDKKELVITVAFIRHEHRIYAVVICAFVRQACCIVIQIGFDLNRRS